MDQEKGIGNSFSDDAIFAHFAARKGQPYPPTGRDRQALSSLRAAGYSFQEIIAGIDQAFDRGDQPKRFAYCARIVQDTPPAHSPAAPVRLPDVADSMLQPDHIDNAPTPIDIPVDLAKAVEMYRGSGQELRPDVIARLRLLAEECDAAARQHGSTGAEWLTQALQRSLGVADDLLLYAQGVLRNWLAHGPNLDTRPGRAGYRPARYTAPPDVTPPPARSARDWDAE